MERKMKQNHGITLIALIVTIIVLIILAAISIGAITGQDGIIEKTRYSAFATKVKQYEENVNRYLIDEEQNGNNSDDIYITDPEKIKEILGENVENGDENKYVIQDGEIRYNPDEVTNKEEEWLIELGIVAIQPVVPEPPIETGNYLVAGKYYDTLQEAIDAADSGSVIEVINDVEESESITINKDITLNTANKNIDFIGDARMTINDGINVNINGGGILTAERDMSFILNYGNLQTNDITIEASAKGMVAATIYIQGNGTLIANNSNITSITSFGKDVVLNGGKYGNIMNVTQTPFVINDGNVSYIEMRVGGNFEINGGTITCIELADDQGDANLTIGDINEAVNNSNPEIQEIKARTDLAGIKTVINFYNGIIKDCFFDLEDEPGSVHQSQGNSYIYTYNRRPGYKAQNTTDGTILVKE